MSHRARLDRLERDRFKSFDPNGLADRLRAALDSDAPPSPLPSGVLERWEKSSDRDDLMRARLHRALMAD